MEAIIYFAIWAGLFFLMMRFGCGAHVMGGNHGKHSEKGRGARPGDAASLRWIPPITDTDPVCGKTVRTETSKSAVHDGSVFYFCSRDCRERFEAAPGSYLAAPARPPAELEEQIHG